MAGQKSSSHFRGKERRRGQVGREKNSIGQTLKAESVWSTLRIGDQLSRSLPVAELSTPRASFSQSSVVVHRISLGLAFQGPEKTQWLSALATLLEDLALSGSSELSAPAVPEVRSPLLSPVASAVVHTQSHRHTYTCYRLKK